MTQNEVESPYDFRDPALAAAWEAQIDQESGWRSLFFAAFAKSLNARFAAPFSVIELGSGPGHLARAILSATAADRYTAIDYSPAMHDLAARHLESLGDRVRYELRDFRRPNWTDGLGPSDAVLTFMAAHEVRDRDRLPGLFAQVARLLKPGGRFLFADFYATLPEHAGLYLSRQAQREALLACGFAAVELLLDENGMALYAADGQ